MNRRVRMMYALKPFPFRGVELKVDEELQPDTAEQAKLLDTIGLASFKKRRYNNRSISPDRTVVMTTGDQATSDTLQEA